MNVYECDDESKNTRALRRSCLSLILLRKKGQGDVTEDGRHEQMRKKMCPSAHAVYVGKQLLSINEIK